MSRSSAQRRNRFAARFGVAAPVFVAIAGVVLAAEPSISIRTVADGRATVFEVSGLSSEMLAALSKLNADDETFSRLFSVRVVDDKSPADVPAMLGTYAVEGNVLRFTPRFALRPGVRYRAVLTAGGGKPDSITRELTIPRPSTRPTEVVQVYPTSSKLPENHLRFYVHFSAPMSRGEAYEHLRLLRKNGEPVYLPFLEIGEELWDKSGMRLTLLFDPGRVKRGLKPREENGPVLEEGEEYTLVIEPGWHDAAGQPLKSAFKKRFTAGPPVETGLDTGEWRIEPPRSGSSAPLVVRFPRPLDHALLERTLTIAGPAGSRVEGKMVIGDEEKRWEFAPGSPWAPGSYELVIDRSLEDPSGNQIGQPFEVDQLEAPVEEKLPTERVRIRFEISRAKSAPRGASESR